MYSAVMRLSGLALNPTSTFHFFCQAKKGRGQRQREKKRNLSNIIKDQEDFSEEVHTYAHAVVP